VVFTYRGFGTNYRYHRLKVLLNLKMGPVICSETSVRNYTTHYEIAQKSAVLKCWSKINWANMN